jgi:hypothetical protein
MEERIREMVTCTEFEYLARLNGKKLYSSGNFASTGFSRIRTGTAPPRLKRSNRSPPACPVP